MGKLAYRSGVFLAAAFLVPALAMADAGIPMLAFSWPIVLLLLVPVVLIETAYVRRALGASWARSLKGLSIANIVTTLIGFPVTWVGLLVIELLMAYSSAPVVEKHAVLQRWMDTTPGFLVQGVIAAAWLGPTNSKLMITTAFLTQISLSFLISAWIEGKIMSEYFFDVDRKNAEAVVWRANGVSYLFLVLAGTGILLYELRRF